MVNVPTDVKKAEERLAHYHPEHQHFYEPTKVHTGKRLLRIVIAGTGFMADSYDLFVINIGKCPPNWTYKAYKQTYGGWEGVCACPWSRGGGDSLGPRRMSTLSA